MSFEMIMRRGAKAMPATATTVATDRRSFLKITTASGVALALAPAIGGGTASAANALKPTELPTAFVAIAKDGIVTVQINRLDMGQGTETGLAMVLAEELDADWSKVRTQQAPLGAAYADPVFGMHLTGGSNSMKNSYAQYRELGARMRAMLVSAAASQWGVKPSEITVSAGRITAGNRSGEFGMFADAAMKQPIPDKVALKDPAQFKIIGQPVSRLDAPDVARGAKRYGFDMDLPGIKTVVVARAPVFGGRIAKVDDTKARAIKGVSDILRLEGLDRGAQAIAVIADGFWVATQARDALKIEWDLAGLERTDSVKQRADYRALSTTPGLKATKVDAAAVATAPRKITAEYVFPYLAHGAMEPLNVTIAFDGTQATLWYGAQMHNVDAGGVAKVLGIDVSKVMINSLPSGGGFGRRAVPTADYVVEAAQIAKAYRAAGRSGPLRILWTREDDMKGGYYRPSAVHRAEIGLDAAGKVLGWKHTIVSQSILVGSPFEQFMVKDGVDATTVEGIADSPYALPIALEVHNAKANVPVLWWRSVGHTHTAYVMETLVDELARAQNKDPVTYRRELLGEKHKRHLAALDLAVAKSGYGQKSLPAGRAWGVAVHESFGTVVAYVVEASIEKGEPVLHRITAGVHCNLAVNPRSVETQIQGAALMGIGTTLPGAEITLKDGVVQQGYFSEYTVARMKHMPPIDVHIVPSADAPTGVGEPGLPPIAPAIANAVAALTGKVPRELPFKVG
jgi:isoquinoline 1-oxidoreductase subunit beta